MQPRQIANAKSHKRHEYTGTDAKGEHHKKHPRKYSQQISKQEIHAHHHKNKLQPESDEKNKDDLHPKNHTVGAFRIILHKSSTQNITFKNFSLLTFHKSRPRFLIVHILGLLIECTYYKYTSTSLTPLFTFYPLKSHSVSRETLYRGKI